MKPQASKRLRKRRKAKEVLDFTWKQSRMHKDFNRKKLSKLYGIKL